MNYLKLMGVFIYLHFGLIGKGQTIDSFSRLKEPIRNDTIYYPFYNGVQMIEVDNISFWNNKISYLEHTQPRAITHSSLQPPPEPNVYLFRDTSGQIVKAFNTLLDLDTLTKQFRRIPITQKRHFIFSFHKSKEIFSNQVMAYRNTTSFYFKGCYKVYQLKPKTEGVRYDRGLVALIDSFGNFKIPFLYEEIVPLKENLLVSKEGKLGVMDIDQNIILPLKYDSYNWETENIISFSVQKNKNVLYHVNEAKVFRINSYDEIHHLGHLEENKITTVIKEGKWGFIDKNYKEIVPPIYEICEFYPRDNGLGRVFKNNKWGYIDKEAKEVIACKYEHAERFNDEGIAMVQNMGMLFCINKKGNRVFDCKVKTDWEIEENREGKFKIVKQNYHYGLINRVTGKVVLPLIYKTIYIQKNESFYRVAKNNKWGIVDLKFKQVVACKYDKIEELYKGRFIAVRDGKYGVLNKSFKEIIPCEYEHLRYDIFNLVFVKNKRVGVIDVSGKIIIPAIYDELNGFDKTGYSRVKRDSFCGFINLEGKEIIHLKYKRIGYEIENERVWFEEKDKLGFLNSKGMIVVPPIYNFVRDFEQKITGVKLNSKWGFIDTLGNSITPFDYEFIDPAGLGYFEVKKNGKYGIVNLDAKEIIPCIYDDINGYGGKELGFTVTIGNETYRINSDGKRIR